MEQTLKLLVIVYTEDLKGCDDLKDPFDTQIEYYKGSLETFSREFSNNMTIDKL